MWLDGYMNPTTCPTCSGTVNHEDARHYMLHGPCRDDFHRDADPDREDFD